MIGQEELNDRLPRLLDLGGVGVDHHPLRDGGNAGGEQLVGALHLDHTEPARPEGDQMLVIAEDWDVDVQLLGSAEHRGPVGDLNVFSIDCQADGHNPLFLRHGIEVAHLVTHVALGAQLLVDDMEFFSLS